MINIYCDESCHLENDDSSCMVLGAISCLKNKTQRISRDLRSIKINNSLSSSYELKWTKVSMNKLGYYEEIIEYFMTSEALSFRAVIADKTNLHHKDYAQTHEEWYYKMYYLLLRYVVNFNVPNKVYIDYKDTQGRRRISKLEDVLNNVLNRFPGSLAGIQQIDSRESELIQLVDFMTGAISYANRNLSSSLCKVELCKAISKKCNVSLTSATPLDDEKFNLFIWKGQGSK